MSDLASKKCIPCSGEVPALKGDELAPLLAQLEGWEVVEEHHLTRTFTFKDFVEALAYVNKVGAVAEEEGHHPDIYFTWGKARIDIMTHAIDGLSESDFILAAKIDKISA
ncbi:MAG: 4a-hydroxytetrahydrobiopterin dehydratase, partial [Myxococcota bacterium]